MASGSDSDPETTGNMNKLIEDLKAESATVAEDFSRFMKITPEEYIKVLLQRMKDVAKFANGLSAGEDSGESGDNPSSVSGKSYFKGPGHLFDEAPDNEDTILIRKLGMYDFTRCVAAIQQEENDDDDDLLN